MPIRYTRVGWQDAPSTETPIDAANLNHMDNGILALSEEVDTELPLLRDQINDVSTDIESQIDEKIPPEVSSWLTEHVTPAGSAVVVDDSLTIQGAAADAKKTGDELTSLKEDFTEIRNEANLVGGEILRSAFRQVGALSQYLFPSALSWVDAYITVLTDGKHFFVIEGGAKKAKLTGGTTYFVHTKKGASGNTGLTRESPKPSVASAVSVASSGDTIVILDDNSYCIPAANGLPNSPCEKSLNIIAENGARIFGGLHYAYTDQGGGVYFASRSAVYNVIDMSVSDVGLKYVQKTSLADCQATKGSWYQNGSSLYVHTIDNRTPDENICVCVYDLCSFRNANFYIENLTFIGGGGTGNIRLYETNENNYLFGLKDCKFLYSKGLLSGNKNSVYVVGNVTAIFENCESAFAKSDGFNYSAENTRAAKFIEINCCGHDNGDNSISGNVNNNNGSTAHAGCTGVRINGSYYNNMGPNVADTATGTKTVNLGCIAYDSHSTDSATSIDFIVSGGDCEAWLQGCIANGNSSENLQAYTGCTMHVKNTIYGKKSGGGTFDES